MRMSASMDEIIGQNEWWIDLFMQEALLIYWSYWGRGTTCWCYSGWWCCCCCCSPCLRRLRPRLCCPPLCAAQWHSSVMLLRCVQRAHQLCLFTAADLPLPTFALPVTFFLPFLSILLVLFSCALLLTSSPVSFLLCGHKTCLFLSFFSAFYPHPNRGLLFFVCQVHLFPLIIFKSTVEPIFFHTIITTTTTNFTANLASFRIEIKLCSFNFIF